ncbi:hypothetical protein AZE42_10262 [Rhizopogon vesiculosus]|uniref:Uncharacterized protein n=1 Tax=Rhizopogon vesiculosus TaxID=180088 RepID=A0A1J8PL22_9AGAM|nr:hypothetical protein AZE42_10262 [Rhizopogon vesiculosus]
MGFVVGIVFYISKTFAISSVLSNALHFVLLQSSSAVCKKCPLGQAPSRSRNQSGR